MSRQIIYLIDGTSLCYRAFYAIKLSNSKGFPAGAIYGYLTALTALLEKYEAVYAAVCFDISRQTFRQEKYKKYKINRPPAPDELRQQIPLVKQITGLLGLALIEKSGFEADDLIAGLAQKASEQEYKAVIVTPDKDLLQLITDDVTIFNPAKGIMIDRDKFVNEFGFEPARMIDYLALTGDTSDNIPGAKGIGKINAGKLVKEFGTVETMFENIESIKGKIKDALLNSKNEIILSKELVKLQPWAPDLDLIDFKIQPIQKQALCEIFRELEFKSLLKSYIPSQQICVPVLEDCHDASTLAEKGKLFLYAREKQIYIYRPSSADIVILTRDRMRDLLTDLSIATVTIGMPAQVDAVVHVDFDIGIAAYLLSPESGDYSLENLTALYLNSNITGIDPKQYPVFIYRLYQIFDTELKKQNLADLFYTVEMPLAKILADASAWGVSVDQAQMKKLLTDVDARLARTQKEIYALAGKEFNLNSPAQVGRVLFEDLKIPVIKKNKTGYVTNEEVLEKIAPEFSIAARMLEYRQLHKLKTTYIVPLQNDLTVFNGKLHARFNQTATATGRLSSSSPNLQSIPGRGELSQELRRAFVPSFKDGVILSADYSQIELRILAHFSLDPVLLAAFAQNQDIHRLTASIIFGVQENDIDETQRDMAKRVNFGIMYGMSAFGLAKELHCGAREAQTFIDEYFSRYVKVREYFQNLYSQARIDGYVRTILGRKRVLPEINSSLEHMREFARRQALNAPIQGSCADLIKTAMIAIDKSLREKKLQSRLIMQIHDELIFDVPIQEIDCMAVLVKQNMETALTLNVPIKVNVSAGKNWADVMEINMSRFEFKRNN